MESLSVSRPAPDLEHHRIKVRYKIEIMQPTRRAPVVDLMLMAHVISLRCCSTDDYGLGLR